jgi:hypothetical protein
MRSESPPRDWATSPDVRNAGTRPKRREVTSVAATAKRRTSPSMDTASRRGIRSGPVALSTRRVPCVRPTPVRPPTAARRALSARRSCTNRLRAAPTAVRIAISRWRWVPLARSVLAWFVQAISRRRPAAPRSRRRGLPASPTTSAWRGRMATATASLSSPCSSRIASARRSISSSARSRETPSARRPTPR